MTFLELSLRPLPDGVADLLHSVKAPSRLTAHLTLVHDVAAQLLAGIATRWPDVPIDTQSVLRGAAIHDIGKALFPDELTQPGKYHEEAGYQILLERGWTPSSARFARTHGHFHDGLPLEDCLVILADKCWKGNRYDALEGTIARLLAPDDPPWETYMALDDLIQSITAQADLRLAWQSSHPLA